MTTLTNSEGKVLTYTNELVETILLQLNPSNNYYTSGDDDIVFMKIGSNKVLILDYTYHINGNIFQNFTINENTIHDCNLNLFQIIQVTNTYTLQGVYTANGFIGSISELQQVFLAMYDTAVSPHTYTGSKNIDITDSQISLIFPLNINDEVALNPRAYDGAVFELIPGNDNLFFYKTHSMVEHQSYNFTHLQKYAHFTVIVRF